MKFLVKTFYALWRLIHSAKFLQTTYKILQKPYCTYFMEGGERRKKWLPIQREKLVFNVISKSFTMILDNKIIAHEESF